MKKIINQKRYDTDTAQERGYWENNYGRTDFHWCAETLYQKKTGEFFLHGEGNAASKYAESCGNNSWCGGEKIIPVDYETAREWAEKHLEADEYESIFGEISEDEEKITVTFSLPADAVEKLRRIVAKDGGSQSDYIATLIREA